MATMMCSGITVVISVQYSLASLIQFIKQILNLWVIRLIKFIVSFIKKLKDNTIQLLSFYIW